MLIYRVEHPTDGKGPYNGHDWPLRHMMGSDHSSLGRKGSEHPSPSTIDSGLPGIRYGQKCACDSAKSLFRWFTGWWEDLHAAGFVVRVIQVNPDATAVGRHGQVVYDTEGSVLTRTYPIHKFTAKHATEALS